MKRFMPFFLMIGFAATVPASTDSGALRILMNGYAAGTGIREQVMTQHVHGQPIQVYKMILTLRIMNQNGAPQPEDLEIVNYISFDASGSGQQCQRWFHKVSADEKLALSRMQMGTNVTHFPFLQLAISGGAQRFLTDEGNYVYHGNSVQCWETEDFWP